ncbi:thiamine pyrophosphate-dependent enzyme [Nesterenkonia massiliensis]|uniref:2-oxoisovalerate dehydrogenase subunit alpha n=1 Tax=Nesterenkonia massiliensis TaxID=1232429 RepID=A0ABT2HPR2_9MICC|nr:thiamine pyrophosphate-dependent enzyme [Nesterenkonia massiliensis]MCT1606672.1 thiamine pyrophosphate-dependent enzyme [Nesterenkonia massiliensis]
MEPVQLLSPDGTLREDERYSPFLEALDDAGLRDLYRHMALERRFDQEATSLQRQGQLALWVPALGQEAAQVGTIAALKPTDRVFPTYREHAMALYRGISAEELMATFRATKHAGWDPHAYNFHGYSIVLAAQTLHAAGWAMAVKQDERLGLRARDKAADEIVLACLGDGASSQGDVHESMVFASSYELPLLYFIQNNHWAISVPTVTQSRHPLVHRADGYGFEGVRVDGNDVLASYAVAAEMAVQIRNGSGPKLIESVTYRIGAHTTADDPTKYRSDDEVQAWAAKDPVTRFRSWLESGDRADQAYFTQVQDEAEELATELRRAVLAMESIDIERVFDTVYAEPHRQVEVEKAWLKDYEAGFAEAGEDK